MFHCSTRALRICCSDSSWFWSCQTHIPCLSNRSSIGDKSVDSTGHGRTRMWWCSKKSCDMTPSAIMLVYAVEYVYLNIWKNNYHLCNVQHLEFVLQSLMTFVQYGNFHPTPWPLYVKFDSFQERNNLHNALWNDDILLHVRHCSINRISIHQESIMCSHVIRFQWILVYVRVNASRGDAVIWLCFKSPFVTLHK